MSLNPKLCQHDDTFHSLLGAVCLDAPYDTPVSVLAVLGLIRSFISTGGPVQYGTGNCCPGYGGEMNTRALMVLTHVIFCLGSLIGQHFGDGVTMQIPSRFCLSVSPGAGSKHQRADLLPGPVPLRSK